MKNWFTYRRSAWSRRATAITCAGFLAVGAAALGSLVFNGQLFAASNPPAPTIQSGPANPTNQTSGHFLFTDSQSGVTLWCSLDNPTFTLCASPQDYTGLAAGDHSFKVQARSGTQTSANTEYKWKIDVTPPPAPQITAQPTDPTTSTAASFTFKDSEGGVTFLCSLDGAAYSACTSPKAYSGLGVGPHRFGVEAQDAAGNLSAATTDNWTIQGVAPPAPTITAKPSDPTASTSATFSFTDTSPSATFLCKLDAGAYAACTSPKTYAGPLAEGTHTFSVEAVANAQTSAATSFTWRVDTTAPTIAVSFPTDGSVYNAAAWNAGCAGGAGICGSAIDPSGVAGGAVSTLRAATGKYWDGTGFSSSSEIFNAATPTSQSGTTFSGGYALALPPDGSYTLHVRAQDNLGNTTPGGSQVVINFTIDTAPPAAPAITSSPASVTPSSTASFSFTGEAGATFLCKLDSGSFVACSSPQTYSGLAAGSHTFSVEAKDAAGNVGSASSYTWTVGVPAPTITSNPANPTNVQTASFSFTDSDAAASFLCKLDSAAYAACTSPKSYSGLAAGSHTFSVEAKDGALVSAPTSFTWTVDLTAPPAPSITAKPSNPSSNPAPTFSFTDTEAGVTFLCKLDGGSFVACSSPQGYSGLGAGSHTFSVEAKDAAGNVGSATSYTWTIDLTPPPAPTIGTKPAALTSSSSASFTFTDTEAGTTFLCQLDGSSFAACTSPKSYTGLADGQHTFSVEAVDAAGNASAPASYTWTVDTTPPAAPTITSSPANPTNQTSATFAFNSEAGATFLCSLDNSAFAACASPQSYPGPLSSGSHTFKVEAKDAAGNVGPATTYTWTIDTTPPPAPTINSKPANPTNQTSATFDFSDAKAGTSFLCSLDGSAFAPCPDPQTYSGPLSAGSHTFKVEAKDTAGNIGPATTYTWLIDLTPPPAPTITSNPPSLSNSSSATFAFTDGEAGATFSCQVDIGVPAPCTSPKSYNLADGQHTFAVYAKDAAGNFSTSAASYTWTIDTTPPPMPTFVSKPPAVDTSTTATFQFADTEAGVTYLCKLDAGTFQPCSNPVTYTGLATGDHHIDVEAQDAAGNVSSNLAYHWKIVSTTGQPFSIAGNAVNAIYPGGAASPINLVFTNPNTSPITVTDVTVTVSGTSVPACGAGNFTIPQQLQAQPIVPANSTKSLSDLGVPQSQWPTLAMLDTGNQNLCKTATVNLGYSGNATG